MRMKNIPGIILIIFLVFAVFIYFFAGNNEFLDTVINNIAEEWKMSFKNTVSTEGLVKVQEEFRVRAPFTGIVEEVLVKEGDTVQKGAPVLKIVGKEIERSLEKARFELLEAQKDYNELIKKQEIQKRKNQIQLKKVQRELELAQREMEQEYKALEEEKFKAEQALVEAKKELSEKEKKLELNKELFQKKVIPLKTLKESEEAYKIALENLKQAKNSLKVLVEETIPGKQKILKLKVESASSRLKLLEKSLSLDDLTENDLALAQKRIELSQKRIKELEDLLKRKMVKSPFSGTVVSLNVKAGDEIFEGTTAAIVMDLDKLFIEARVSEEQINKVLPGQRVTITGEAFDEKLNGLVNFIEPVASKIENRNIFKTKIKIEDNRNLLKPGMLVHVEIIPNEEQKEKRTIIYAPRKKIVHEFPLNQQPAWCVDKNNTIHYLACIQEDKLQYLLLNSNGGIIKKKVINSINGLKVGYFFPIENFEEPEFLCVFKDENKNFPYLLRLTGEGEFIRVSLPFEIAGPKDIDVIKQGENYYFVYVEEKGGFFRLYFQEFKGSTPGNRLEVDRSEDFLGLPRLTGNNDVIHLTWRASKRDAGKQIYSKIDLKNGGKEYKEQLVLGKSQFFFCRTPEGKEQLFFQDPGAQILTDAKGNVYLAWTNAYWIRTFNNLHSSVFLVRISPEGRVEKSWEFKGSQDFTLFADLAFVDELPIIFMEDYIDRNFWLYVYKFDQMQDDFTSRELFTKFYGNHRLVSAGKDKEGNLLVFWKQLSGKEDFIWFRTGSQASVEKWYDRWSMWFMREPGSSKIREGFFLLVYAIIGATIGLARNFLTLAVFFTMFYFLRKFRLLKKMNFFLMLSIILVIIFIFKNWFPVFYSTPVVEPGRIIFSALIATLVVILKGKKNWVKSCNEETFLPYIILWIFVDCLISYLFVAPGIMAP